MSAGPGVARALAAHWPLWVVCALFLLAGALALDDYGIRPDTWAQRAIGNAALDYLAGDGERAFKQLHDPESRYYGAVFEAPLVLLLEHILGLSDEADIFPGRNVLTHLFFLVGGGFCYLLVLRMFGSRPLALMATALFLLHPRLYAHSFFNVKDIPFLAMFMITLYLTHRAFRRDTLAAFLLCGVGVGLLVNLRIMGVILFTAVLALRGLDLGGGGSAKGRKRILLTGGGFALTAMLTFHASLPALWTDPFGRFAELVRTFASHPKHAHNLFQGEWLYSVDGLPFDYLPVWVGITTPPAVLLLALAGAVALAWRGLRRPHDILRNGALRFGLLLAALPAVTNVAIVVLENNVYENWRHLYYLYAPLLLLAIIGLHQLVSIPHGPWPRVGAYALGGAAVAVTVVSMVRIHPYQQPNYFNVLTDRTTPERLIARYDPSAAPWDFIRSTLTDIAGDHPAGKLSPDFRDQHRLLWPDDRKRFAITRDFRSGERNFYVLAPADCLAASPSSLLYVGRLYASTHSCVVDPVAYFGRLRREALADPVVRSVYAIRRDGRLLTYARDGCPLDDVEGESTRFFLHVIPAGVNAVRPAWRRPNIRRHGFDNLDYALWSGSARIDGNCVAAILLPDYPIAAVRTGQYTNDGVLWEANIAFAEEAPDYAAARREALASDPIARSVYDVHLAGRALTYVRDGCTDEEADARFLLHVVPADAGDLPEHRREHGFDNLDFTLATRGARLDGNCVAVARLPDYPIATVRTGQYDDAGALWTAEFPLPDGER